MSNLKRTNSSALNASRLYLIFLCLSTTLKILGSLGGSVNPGEVFSRELAHDSQPILLATSNFKASDRAEDDGLPKSLFEDLNEIGEWQPGKLWNRDLSGNLGDDVGPNGYSSQRRPDQRAFHSSSPGAISASSLESVTPSLYSEPQVPLWHFQPQFTPYRAYPEFERPPMTLGGAPEIGPARVYGAAGLLPRYGTGVCHPDYLTEQWSAHSSTGASAFSPPESGPPRVVSSQMSPITRPHTRYYSHFGDNDPTESLFSRDVNLIRQTRFEDIGGSGSACSKSSASHPLAMELASDSSQPRQQGTAEEPLIYQDLSPTDRWEKGFSHKVTGSLCRQSKLECSNHGLQSEKAGENAEKNSEEVTTPTTSYFGREDRVKNLSLQDLSSLVSTSGPETSTEASKTESLDSGDEEAQSLSANYRTGSLAQGLDLNLRKLPIYTQVDKPTKAQADRPNQELKKKQDESVVSLVRGKKPVQKSLLETPDTKPQTTRVRSQRLDKPGAFGFALESTALYKDRLTRSARHRRLRKQKDDEMEELTRQVLSSWEPEDLDPNRNNEKHRNFPKKHNKLELEGRSKSNRRASPSDFPDVSAQPSRNLFMRGISSSGSAENSRTLSPGGTNEEPQGVHQKTSSKDIASSSEIQKGLARKIKEKIFKGNGAIGVGLASQKATQWVNKICHLSHRILRLQRGQNLARNLESIKQIIQEAPNLLKARGQKLIESAERVLRNYFSIHPPPILGDKEDKGPDQKISELSLEAWRDYFKDLNKGLSREAAEKYQVSLTPEDEKAFAKLYLGALFHSLRLQCREPHTPVIGSPEELNFIQTGFGLQLITLTDIKTKINEELGEREATRRMTVIGKQIAQSQILTRWSSFKTSARSDPSINPSNLDFVAKMLRITDAWPLYSHLGPKNWPEMNRFMTMPAENMAVLYKLSGDNILLFERVSLMAWMVRRKNPYNWWDETELRIATQTLGVTAERVIIVGDQLQFGMSRMVNSAVSGRISPGQCWLMFAKYIFTSDWFTSPERAWFQATPARARLYEDRLYTLARFLNQYQASNAQYQEQLCRAADFAASDVGDSWWTVGDALLWLDKGLNTSQMIDIGQKLSLDHHSVFTETLSLKLNELLKSRKCRKLEPEYKERIQIWFSTDFKSLRRSATSKEPGWLSIILDHIALTKTKIWGLWMQKPIDNLQPGFSNI